MAYGYGDRDSVKRLLPLGVGELGEAKRGVLTELRHRYLAIAEAMAAPAFDPEPLSGQTDIEAVLTAFQREHVKGFNKAYAEKTRLAVTAHLTEQRRRYFNQLVGRLRHAASRIEDAETPRRYYYVPEAMQDVITSAELEALQSRGEDYAQALELFRAVVLRGELAGLTANQLAVVREIHAQAQQRYRLPRYGADPEFVCQIHLDYRVIRGDGVTPLREGARLLVDKANARYHVFLEISHPVPHQAPIRLPLSLQSWTLRRLLGDGEDAARETTLKSLVLEIGRRRVGRHGQGRGRRVPAQPLPPGRQPGGAVVVFGTQVPGRYCPQSPPD